MPNTLVQKYKGLDIFLNEKGKFSVSINSVEKTFSSLQSTKNAIDKEAITDFSPVEALVIDEQDRGYHNPTKYVVRKIKLIDYREEKEFRRDIRRFYLTEGGEKFPITGYGRTALYPVSDFKKLTEMAKERTALEKLEDECSKKSQKIGEQWGKMVVSFDPRPDAK